MRYYLLLIGAIPLLALGLDLYFSRQEDARDVRLLATAEQYVVGALDPAAGRPRVEHGAIAERSPGIWAVSGDLRFEGEATPQAYIVEIQELCGSPTDPDCWQPRRLAINGETIEVSEAAIAASSPPQGEGEQSEESEDLAAIESASNEAVTDSKTTEPAEDKQAPAMELPASASAEPTPSEAPMAETADATQQQAAKGIEMSVEESLVWLIQDRLNQLGYAEGAVVPSGIMDPNTREAIRTFQADAGLPNDGAPSFALLDRLDSQLALADSAPESSFVAALPEEEGSAEGDSVPLPMPKASDGGGSTLIPPPPQAAATSAAPEPVPAPGPAAVPEPAAAPPVQPETAAASAQAPIPLVSSFEADSLYAEGDSSDGAAPQPSPQAAPELVASESAGSAATGLQPHEVQTAAVPTEALAEDSAPSADEAEVDESLVFLIQDRLNKLGYGEPTPISLDGSLGPRTRAAITDYREKHALTEHGPPTEALLRHMQGELAKRRASAAAQPEPLPEAQ